MPDAIPVRWTEPAAQDLEHISEYIQNDRPAAAATVVKTLFEAANSLNSLPARGRIGKVPGTRELVVPGLPYIIVYRLTGTMVQVLRIYHGAQSRRGKP
jgi:toxin ParE1/3/4